MHAEEAPGAHKRRKVLVISGQPSFRAARRSGIIGTMDSNWTALAAAMQQRRKALRLSQVELADEAGVSRSTIQKLEWGQAPGVSRKTLGLVETALQWAPGSANAVLRGGAPMATEELSRTRRVVHEGNMDPETPLSDRLPASVIHAMAGKELYATDTYDLTVDGGMSLIVVVVRDPDDPNHPKDFAQLREENRAWMQAQHKLRGMEPLKWEPGDPEEWKEDSGTATGE